MFRQTFGAITAASIAFISLAGAIIGITISATNMKNDFEAAKARVAELEGQVAALQRVIDKPAQAGAPGPQGPPGQKGEPGEKGEPGLPGAAVDGNELRRLVTSIVRDEMAKRPALAPSTGNAAQTAAEGGATAAIPAKAGACVDAGKVRDGILVQAEEGARFCAADGAIVMELKDIGPGGQLAVGTPADAGKWCKECEAPWDAALKFRAEKVEPLGNGFTALLRFGPG